MGRFKAFTGLLTIACACVLSLPFTAAQAQSPLYGPPPRNYSVDGQGVDLTSGRYLRSETPVQIGSPGASGLSYSRTYIGGLSWRDNVTGTLNFSGTTYSLSIGATTDVFTRSGTTFTPQRDVGQTLTLNGSIYVYTMPDGTIARFDSAFADRLNATLTQANAGRLTEIVRPNGETLSLSYEIAEPEEPDQPSAWVIRLAGVVSNYGYGLWFAYDLDDISRPDQAPSWMRMKTVKAFNRAECQDLAFCSSPTVWPSATFSGPNTTDQSGRTTFFGSVGPQVLGVRYPANPTVDAETIVLDSSGRVVAYTSGGGTWAYSYVTSGGLFIVTITDPASGVSQAVTTVSTGLLASFKDQLNRETTYEYDSNGRVTKITLPAGNTITYAYDARGNVTQTAAAPPPASTETPIVTTATYAATCTNRVTCNLPLTTTDPRGAVTDYTYDATHGGVTSVTQPAPSTGADRPQTRITYASQSAWISDGAGGYTAATPAITLPVSTSACSTGTSCAGTAAEVKSTVTYGATGVANNLNPTSVSSGSGDGLLTATTTATYDSRGDVTSVDGPLPGSADTTSMRYDSARQVVGIIGPDPDGAGPLLNRAVRNTYNADGAVTLVEQGTVTGRTDPAWAAFSSLQQQAATYDTYGRPTHQRAQSGGTTYTLAQVSYDTSGRVDCTATRMNPTAFASPPASACTASGVHAYGPDRIARNGYDLAGQLISTTSGYGSAAPITEAATYTANGQPQTLTDGNGNVSIMAYDGFDRLTRLRYPNPTGGGTSTTDYEDYVYDAASNVTIHRNRAGQTILAAYDALNRQVALGGSAVADRTFAYDNLGRPTTAAFVNGGFSFTNSWDALGRMTAQYQPPIGSVSYSYDLAGRRTSIAWPDGYYATYAWNLAGELVGIAENGTQALASLSYDNLGRRVGIGRGNGVASAYIYDGIGRLSRLSHSFAAPGNANQLYDYGYNPAGQIITRTNYNSQYNFVPATATTGYANDGLNRVTALTGAGAATVGYDANQNITTGLGTTYGYNALNELTSAGGATFTYDAVGRLHGSTGSVTRRYLYDGQQVIAEYDGAGTMVSRYVPGAGLDDIVTAYAGSGTTNRSWLLADERGSVIALSDGSGTATTINTYDEYGMPGSGNAGRFQYTGQMWLPDAALYHARARAYAPQIGRFLQTDPVGYAAGANLYAYVGGDPVNWADPLGLSRSTVGGREYEVCVDIPTAEGSLIESCIRRRGSGSGSGWRLGALIDGLLGLAVDVSGGGGGGGGGVYDGLYRPENPTPSYATEEGIRQNAAYQAASERHAIYAEPILVLMPGGSIGRLGRVGGIFSRVCNCFTADTLVETTAGRVAISKIAVGDLVLSRDEANGETAYKPVVALIDGAERTIWQVLVETVDVEGTARRETIGSTDEHPWRLVGGDWRETAELAPGDQLVTADGRAAVVVSVSATDRVERTYNLEVADFHTFFVGAGGLWVHNACRPFDFPRSVKALIRAMTPNCANCGVMTIWGVRNVRGVSPPPNQSHIHHRVPGVGRGVEDGVNLCRTCHRLEHPR